jgi:hypothetical protein
MCPGGMLAADAIGLPDELRTVDATPENAQHTLASLQGALLMARFRASPAFRDATTRALRDWLTHTRPDSAD